MEVVVGVGAEGMDGHDPVRVQCLGESSEVIDGGVPGGVVLNERDVMLGQEAGESLPRRIG